MFGVKMCTMNECVQRVQVDIRDRLIRLKHGFVQVTGHQSKIN